MNNKKKTVIPKMIRRIMKERKKTMNHASIAFCLYWRMYLSQLNDFDRLYEEILVNFVECSEKDKFSLVFGLEEKLNIEELKKEASNIHSVTDIFNTLSDENLKIQGLKEIIYGQSNVFADTIAFDKDKNTTNDIIKILPCITSLQFNKEEFTKKFKKGTDCLWDFRFNNTIEQQIESYNKLINANTNKKKDAQFEIYSDVFFAASMALACFYRKANNTKDGWQLLEAIKKKNLFQEKPFFHHMHVRFEIFQISDYEVL